MCQTLLCWQRCGQILVIEEDPLWILFLDSQCHESCFLPGAFLSKVGMALEGFGSPLLPHWFLDTLKADFLQCFLIFVGESLENLLMALFFLLINILVWDSVSLISPVGVIGAKLNSTCIFDFASEKIHTGIFFF